MEHPGVKGWDLGTGTMYGRGPYTLVRSSASGRIWAYPTKVAEWMLDRHPKDWEFVCDVPDVETAIQIRRLANDEIDRELKG